MSMMYKRVLCGVDFSQASVGAFAVAVEFARVSRAGLHVLHCIEAHPVAPQWLPGQGPDDTVTALEERARRAMEALVATSASGVDGVRLTTEITPGLAFAEILDRARGSDVDLIVLGGTGLTLLEESVFGGTAERVVRDAACSVLVVRGPRGK